MQDLTHDPRAGAKALLVPSSQEGGNLIQGDLAANTMTAPGSEPVSPLPTALDGSHPVPTYSHPEIPVSYPGANPRPAVQPASSGANADRWGKADGTPRPSKWQEQ